MDRLTAIIATSGIEPIEGYLNIIKRIALVIGNSEYANSPLKNPVNDAKDVAAKLRKLGFDVIERDNLTTKQIGRTLSEFRSKLVPGSVALVFYAGHGLQIKGENYLPAVDAEITAEEDVANQSLAVRQIMEVLDDSKTRLNLVFLDACRNNPYARSFRSAAGEGLARITAPSGTLISYATRPGSVAQDGNGRNGLYTSKLLAQMDSNQQIELALKQVVTDVKAASQGKQEPWMEGSIEGSFCFAGCQVSSLEPAPSPVHVKSKEEIEQETWESIRDLNDIDAITEYLKQYPQGKYVALANIQLKKLTKNAERPVTNNITRQAAEPVGYVYQGELTWMPISFRKTWADANAYCSDTAINGQSGWRLPTKDELKALFASEAINSQGWTLGGTWSSTPSIAPDHYFVHLDNGLVDVNVFTDSNSVNYVTCVRSETAQTTMLIPGITEAQWEKYKSTFTQNYAPQQITIFEPAMVRIPGRNFEIGKYDVTRGEFAKFVSVTGYDAGNECYIRTGSALDKRSGSNWRNPGFSQDDTHPVTCVNWNDAQAYLSWLSKQTGRQYHLPTEAEWEYACYGGSQTEFCGGNEINAVAWYDGNSGGHTHPVGQKQANGYGLYDMSGNVWQWMENLYDSSHPEHGRALRGGSWEGYTGGLRTAFRIYFPTGIGFPTDRHSDLGFRLARTLP